MERPHATRPARGARTAFANVRVAVAAARWRWRLRASEAPGVSRQDQRLHGWGFKSPQLGPRSPRVFATGVCDAEPGRLFGASHVFVSLSGIK